MTPHSISRISIVLAATLVAMSLAGCQQGQKQPTEREQAAVAWNSARAAEWGRLANDAYKSGNFAGSRRMLGEALKISPYSASLNLLAAKLAIQAGQFEIASQDLLLARANPSSNGEPYYLTGLIQQRQQQPEKAYESYKLASAKSPAEPTYLLAQSEMLVMMNRMPEAIALLQSHLNSFPDNGAIRDSLGGMLMQTGNYPQAVAMLSQAAVLDGANQGIRQQLALAQYAVGDYRQCAQNVASLLATNAYSNRADLFILLGDCQLHVKDGNAARATFATATQLDGFSSRAWQGRGKAELETGNLKNAETFLTHSLWLDQANSSSRISLGYVRLSQTRYDEALAYFQTASVADARDTESLCMIGYTLEKMGRRGDATSYYKRALDMKPGDQMASQLMASIDLNDLGE